LLAHFRGARVRRGVSIEAAIRYAFGAAGRAMTMTAVIMAGGLALPGCSAFALDSTLAAVAGLSLVGAFVAGWLLLPALLLPLRFRRVVRGAAAPAADRRD